MTDVLYSARKSGGDPFKPVPVVQTTENRAGEDANASAPRELLPQEQILRGKTHPGLADQREQPQQVTKESKRALLEFLKTFSCVACSTEIDATLDDYWAGNWQITAIAACASPLMGQWYLDRFSRYNSVSEKIVGEAFRNAELGVTSTTRFLYAVCIDK